MNLATAITLANTALEKMLLFGGHKPDCVVRERTKESAPECSCGWYDARKDVRAALQLVYRATDPSVKELTDAKLDLSSAREALRDLLEADEPERKRTAGVRAKKILGLSALGTVDVDYAEQDEPHSMPAD